MKNIFGFVNKYYICAAIAIDGNQNKPHETQTNTPTSRYVPLGFLACNNRHFLHCITH